jgi:hypothetical protein
MSKLVLTPEQLADPKLKLIIANKLKGLKARAKGTHKGSNNGRYGKEVKKSTREKLRVSNTGYKHTDEAKRKSARPGKLNGFYGRGEERRGEKNHFYGKKHNQEVKEKLKDVSLNREKNCYCIYCNDYFTKQSFKQHHGEKCRENPNYLPKNFKKGWKNGNQDKLMCPYCGFCGGQGNMSRYHMDNCEFNGFFIASFDLDNQIKIYKSIEGIITDGMNWHKIRGCINGKFKHAYKKEWKKVSNK